ncbi:MAG: flavin-dependent thymidylate synthase [Patescibacteria group bacterium]|nr:MAG: flavin-dependent thymidylate synthase [Patescibacteria group bacterium]
MNVRLIYPDRDKAIEYRGLIWLAARTCYSSDMPEQLWDDYVLGKIPLSQVLRVLSHVITSGHHSTIEHINFTFTISGVSRVLTHQLVRHRIGIAFDQQSQRYVRPDGDVVVPPSIANNPNAMSIYNKCVDSASCAYQQLVRLGVPEEDARFLLPQATKTNLIMTVNLRQLIHISSLRLCTLAQWEIRRLFKKIRKEMLAFDPLFGRLLTPKCVWMGYCDEKRNADGHCKIRPYRPSSLIP